MELIKALQLYKLHSPFYEEAAVGNVFFVVVLFLNHSLCSIVWKVICF